MISYRSLSQSRKRRAIAAVEAAAILPTFILFAAAILDLGRVAKATNAVDKAARTATTAPN